MRESLYDFCIANRKEALLRQWDREKNAPLTPSNVSQGSHKKVFWRCENNHVWNAAVYARTEGSGCPYCTGRKVMSDFNDLASVNPSLAAQWDSEKNAPLKPERVSVGSHRSVWWRCESGHSWRAVIRSRSAGCGCPYCTGKKIAQGENDFATNFRHWLRSGIQNEMVRSGRRMCCREVRARSGGAVQAVTVGRHRFLHEPTQAAAVHTALEKEFCAAITIWPRGTQCWLRSGIVKKMNR